MVARLTTRASIYDTATTGRASFSQRPGWMARETRHSCQSISSSSTCILKVVLSRSEEVKL